MRHRSTPKIFTRFYEQENKACLATYFSDLSKNNTVLFGYINALVKFLTGKEWFNNG